MTASRRWPPWSAAQARMVSRSPYIDAESATRLRLNLMHAGWPYLQDAIAILMLYPNVNVDTGALAWLLPRPAFHDILGQLVKAASTAKAKIARAIIIGLSPSRAARRKRDRETRHQAR